MVNQTLYKGTFEWIPLSRTLRWSGLHVKLKAERITLCSGLPISVINSFGQSHWPSDSCYGRWVLMRPYEALMHTSCSTCLFVPPRPLIICAWSTQEPAYHVSLLNFHIHLYSVMLYVGMYVYSKVGRNVRCTQGWQGKHTCISVCYVCYLVYYPVYIKCTIIFTYLLSHYQSISLTHHSFWKELTFITELSLN